MHLSIFIYLSNIYIAPLKDVKSAALSALAYTTLIVVKNEYFQSIIAKLYISTVSWKSHQRRTHAYTWNKPTDSRRQVRQLWDDKELRTAQNLWTAGYVDRVVDIIIYSAMAGDSVGKHVDDADEHADANNGRWRASAAAWPSSFVALQPQAWLYTYIPPAEIFDLHLEVNIL